MGRKAARDFFIDTSYKLTVALAEDDAEALKELFGLGLTMRRKKRPPLHLRLPQACLFNRRGRMVAMLTKKTKVWLSRRYPRLLNFEQKDRVILKGLFDFNRTYAGAPIQDAYRVYIEIPKNGSRAILREVGGRLQNVLKNHPELKNGKTDLHIYNNDTLCIMTPKNGSLSTKKNLTSKNCLLIM